MVLAGGKSATRRVTRDVSRTGQGAGKLLTWRRERGGWRVSGAAGTELCWRKREREKAEHLETPQHFRAYLK